MPKTWKEKRKELLRVKRLGGLVETLLIEFDPLTKRTVILQRDLFDPKEIAYLKRSE